MAEAQDSSAGKTPDFKWVFYEYGGPPEPYFSKAQKEVWKRYGVETYGFGCEVTAGLSGDIKTHNDSLFALLQPKYPGLTEDRILGEMQSYVTTQKSIEGVIAPYLRAQIRHCVPPAYYPETDWWLLDTTGKVYGVKIALRNCETGVWENAVTEMKVMPETGDYLVRNAAGKWEEP